MSLSDNYIKGFEQTSEQFKTLLPKQNNIVCKSISDWSDEWYKSILPENNKLSLKFDKWNDEFNGKLRSKLVPIIGYGGTKKSLLSLNIAYDNIVRGLGKCIYSTMESGATEIINRLIDIHCEPITDKFNPHLEIEYHNNIKKDLDAKKFYKDSFSKALMNSFFLTENTSLEAESYDKLFTGFENENNKPDILIVDGLAGMGGRGSETELYSRHSKELKDLANKWKIMIFLICHVSKGGKKTDRDLSDKVRSSEKIIDNCDFYITNSLFTDGDEFNKNYGALRLINKRGTGNTVDVVYEFNKQKLTMEQTDFDFNQFSGNEF